jgi:2-phosphosulfolactate phosphatase
MRNIEVCPTPELVDLYGVEGKIVVVVDILRATTCMTTAFAHGIDHMIPVAKLEECKALQNSGYIAAAERDGKMAEGFDIGNSPFTYMDPKLKGKGIAVTTTNGTQAIVRSAKADQIIIGSFLNRSAVARYLRSQTQDVLIVCAGWKGKVNLEDTLYAGALVEDLQNDMVVDSDSAIAAQVLYNVAKSDMVKFLSNSSHVRRLNGLNIHKDIEFCLTSDVYDVIPVMEGKKMVAMKEVVAVESNGHHKVNGAKR